MMSVGAEATPSKLNRNSQKFEKQFSLISSYFLGVKHFCPNLFGMSDQKSYSGESRMILANSLFFNS